jgi:hypothetical protein
VREWESFERKSFWLARYQKSSHRYCEVIYRGEPWLLWSLHIIYIWMVRFELEKKEDHFRLNNFNLLGKAKLHYKLTKTIFLIRFKDKAWKVALP